MDQKQKLEKMIIEINAATDDLESLLSKCEALAPRDDDIKRSKLFDGAVCDLDGIPAINTIWEMTATLNSYHADLATFKTEMRCLREMVSNGKTEWSQSGVVREEAGCLEFEVLEGDDSEVFAKREKSLKARRSLADMELLYLFLSFRYGSLFDSMSKTIALCKIICDYVITNSHDIASGVVHTFDQHFEILKVSFKDTVDATERCVSSKVEFHAAAAKFRELMS
jgi:hypothetical protein